MNSRSKRAVSDSPSVHVTEGEKSRPFVMLSARRADGTRDGGGHDPPRFIVTWSVPLTVFTKGDIGKQRINQGFRNVH